MKWSLTRLKSHGCGQVMSQSLLACRGAVKVAHQPAEVLSRCIRHALSRWRLLSSGSGGSGRGRNAPARDSGSGPPTPGNQACLGTDLLASSSVISNTVALHVRYS